MSNLNAADYIRLASINHVAVEHGGEQLQLNMVWVHHRADPIRLWMPVKYCDRCNNFMKLLCTLVGSERVSLGASTRHQSEKDRSR